MSEYLREELQKFLPPHQVEAILTRVENRVQVDRELEMIHLGPLHYHEALDRAHVALAYIDDHIAEHPVIRRHEELAAICDRACDALFDLYQAIGRMPEPSEQP